MSGLVFKCDMAYRELDQNLKTKAMLSFINNLI